METVLLLRSFGDFVVALYHIPVTNTSSKSYRLVASKHLEPLYQSLLPYLSPAQRAVEFKDFGIQHHILSAFTNRYFFTKENVQELKHLQEQMKGISNIVLEQDTKSWLIQLACKNKIISIHRGGNIYDSWAAYYENKNPFKTEISTPKKVLIFPDSRLKRKEITEEVLLKLETQLTGQNIQTSRAYFNNAAKGISYRNFNELLQLIEDADYIISSDSLPAHLAQLLQKPHGIIYANKINQEWVTPFAKENGTAYTFDQISNNYLKIKNTPPAACG